MSLRAIAKQSRIIYIPFLIFIYIATIKKEEKSDFSSFLKTTFLFYVSDNSSSLQRSDEVYSYFSHLRLPSQMQYQAALK